MINNKPIIYYKNNQLDRYRTVKSLLKYYFVMRVIHRSSLVVPVVESNLLKLDAF